MTNLRTLIYVYFVLFTRRVWFRCISYVYSCQFLFTRVFYTFILGPVQTLHFCRVEFNWIEFDWSTTVVRLLIQTSNLIQLHLSTPPFGSADFPKIENKYGGQREHEHANEEEGSEKKERRRKFRWVRKALWVTVSSPDFLSSSTWEYTSLCFWVFRIGEYQLPLGLFIWAIYIIHVGDMIIKALGCATFSFRPCLPLRCYWREFLHFIVFVRF